MINNDFLGFATMRQVGSSVDTTYSFKRQIIVGIQTNAGYESFATVGEIRVWWRADFQSGSRVLKKVF